MNNNNSLKEYYVKLQGLYSDAVNMLTAINQSLSTTASEITLSIGDINNAGNGESTNIRIPSFLYLENKIEQLSNNFDALFDMPNSGEAWFHNDSNMYKLEMVKSTSAPITPKFNTKNLSVSIKDNNILKDMVNPKTYIRLNIDNLPDNISEMYMKKMVFFSKELYDSLSNAGLLTYEDYKAALYNFNPGIDYEEYDSVLDLPIKRDVYKSRFEIIEIPNKEYKNPYYSEIETDSHKHLTYELKLNTITYTDQEDSAQEFTLKAGDYISLVNEHNIYKVKNVTNTHDIITGKDDFSVIIKEVVGHIALQTTDENSSMVFQIYNNNYSKYHYVDIPLEENPYICIFIGTIQNNVRSTLSKPYLIDLNTIYMRNANGDFIFDGNSSKPMTYIQYYNKYCKNIGDLILGLSETAYPQLSNFSNFELQQLTSSVGIQTLVSNTIDNENILSVKRINSHLIDDVTSQNIISLHQQKAEINSQLTTVQNNIDQIYNQLTTTDFSQEVIITQESLKSQINEYYSERLTLQQQYISLVNNINNLKGDAKGYEAAKFRIRGTTVITQLEEYLKANIDSKCNIIGADIEYKYKSINSDTTNVQDINSSLFTDWNKLNNPDRERELVFDSVTGSYKLEFVNYDTSTNIIKWNQVDIPINQGEDVVIRIRYKYNIGQPFIDLYTPWSDTLTVTFPTEYEEVTELYDIIAKNDNDAISARFSNTLITEGYQEHINNKLIDASQTFFHMPENIYSGFNTPENSLISLKDKLVEMNNELTKYRQLIDNELNSEYTVYLQYDNNVVELFSNTNNEVTISEANALNGSFIKKDMNLVIKNTGDIAINFYSIFPGNMIVPLVYDNEQFYEKYICNYERVPLLIDKVQGESGVYAQTLGQWIYFRKNNPYTIQDYYYDDVNQNIIDYNYYKNTINTKSNIDKLTDPKTDSKERLSLYNGTKENAPTIFKVTDYIGKTNKQMLLPYRKRGYDNNSIMDFNIIERDDNKLVCTPNNISDDSYTNLGTEILYNSYKYKYSQSNNYLLRYSDIFAVTKQANITKYFYLDPKTSFISFLNKHKNDTSQEANPENYAGGFLYPCIPSPSILKCKYFDNNQYIKLEVGKSLSVPIKFEYFLNSTTNEVTKTIAFDLRSTLLKDPEHYILSVTAKYNYDVSASDYDSIKLFDQVSDNNK